MRFFLNIVAILMIINGMKAEFAAYLYRRARGRDESK